MVSFVELELAFTFLPETPSVVLGASAPFRTSTAPALPTLEEIIGEDEYERLDLQLDYFTDEQLEAMPLTHRGVMWRALVSWCGNVYIPGPTFTTMHWDPQDTVWSLATRTMPKSSVDEVQAILGPLGVFALTKARRGELRSAASPTEAAPVRRSGASEGRRSSSPERRSAALRRGGARAVGLGC